MGVLLEISAHMYKEVSCSTTKVGSFQRSGRLYAFPLICWFGGLTAPPSHASH